MAQIRKATVEMMPRLLPLLQRFGNARMDAAAWRDMLFDCRWQGDQPHGGHVLVTADERIVGYAGLIFSSRVVRGALQQFCNLSSWIVDESHRLEAVKLILPATRLHSHTVTALTPTRATVRALRSFGFKELETRVVLLTPLTGLGARRRASSARVTTVPAEVRAHLDAPRRRIFDDHRDTHATHLLLTRGGAHCYTVATVTTMRRLPWSHIHYVSEPPLFWEEIGAVRSALLRAHRTPFSMIDARLVGRRLPLTLQYTLPHARLYRPATLEMGEGAAPDGEVQPTDVDGLYSELMWLRS